MMDNKDKIPGLTDNDIPDLVAGDQRRRRRSARGFDFNVSSHFVGDGAMYRQKSPRGRDFGSTHILSQIDNVSFLSGQ
jgi:hypothetical protein